MNNTLLIASVMLILSPAAMYAQKTAPPLSLDTLAVVGTTVITERDLIERIELMPWDGKEQPGQHDSSKIKALNSLVAERLLAIEGKHLNIGTDAISDLKIRGMEKMFVRDELFKREVKQKVTVPEQEIAAGLVKFSTQLQIIAVAVKDRNSADSLWRMLQKNVPLTKMISTIHPSFIMTVETVLVNFGGLDPLFENAVYAMGKKKFSKPFISKTYGWTVAVVLDRGANPVYEKMNRGDRRTRVDEVIRGRKENTVAGQYYAKILAPQKAKTDSSLFFALAKEMRSIIVVDSTGHRNKGLYAVMSEDIDQLLVTFEDDLHRPFVELSERPLSFGEAIEGLRNLRFGFPSLDENAFNHDLNSHLRTLTETELMAREGYRQNLHFAENVKRDLQTWSNYWISRYLMRHVNDSVTVSDEEVLAALISSIPALGTAYAVNVQEVLCDSLTTALSVLNDYSRGMSLSELARRYSQRPDWKERGGVSQFIPLNQYSEITARAFLADTGTIVGPVKIKEGYSLFKVLGKRNGGGVAMPPADSVPVNIRNNLLGRKRSRMMNTYVADLAKYYTIDVHYEKLPSVKIQPANMFTRRVIGFGGIITAVPIVYPNWDWVKEYRGSENIMP